ncbi:MAG: HesA/MoeB/ThiF family protein [Elusimicrobia bacterium]|nr:HesA/MoeB/ThiF family protein [Elusimicrobiota bacterium]
MDSLFTEQERRRYDRQIMLPDWGIKGQKQVKEATVFIAGAGGLGSPAAIYLAVAGAGTIRICDDGEVEHSNLNRQILHMEADIDKKKVFSAQRRLQALNPYVKVEPLFDRVATDTVERLVGGAQIILDCLDNLHTRLVLNEYAVKKRLPLIHGAVHGLAGQLTFIHPPETPCLRCIFPGNPPRDTFPVVGAAPGIIGAFQALEALKHITGIGETLKGKLLIMDGETMEFSQVRVRKNPGCPVCG